MAPRETLTVYAYIIRPHRSRGLSYLLLYTSELTGSPVWCKHVAAYPDLRGREDDIINVPAMNTGENTFVHQGINTC